MQAASLASTTLCSCYSTFLRSRCADARYLARFITERPLSTTNKNVRTTDPTAKRPNRVCDPYGQGGKPLSSIEVKSLLATIHQDWKVEAKQNDVDKQIGQESSSLPVALVREFPHSDFLSGSRFLHLVAAVAEMNAHFPSLVLERRIVKKNWVTVSTIRCHTTVLGGLSHHDFHLAMVRTNAAAA